MSKTDKSEELDYAKIFDDAIAKMRREATPEQMPFLDAWEEAASYIA